MARSVKIGDKQYPVRRQDLALLRELEPLEDQFGDLMAEVDGIDAQMASVQAKLVELASDGEADEEATAALVAQEKDLGRKRRSLGLDQLQVRLAMLAVKLEGTTSDELGEALDLGAGELDRVEDEVSNPPAIAREGATS